PAGDPLNVINVFVRRIRGKSVSPAASSLSLPKVGAKASTGAGASTLTSTSNAVPVNLDVPRQQRVGTSVDVGFGATAVVLSAPTLGSNDGRSGSGNTRRPDVVEPQPPKVPDARARPTPVVENPSKPSTLPNPNDSISSILHSHPSSSDRTSNAKEQNLMYYSDSFEKFEDSSGAGVRSSKMQSNGLLPSGGVGSDESVIEDPFVETSILDERVGGEGGTERENEKSTSMEIEEDFGSLSEAVGEANKGKGTGSRTMKTKITAADFGAESSSYCPSSFDVSVAESILDHEEVRQGVAIVQVRGLDRAGNERGVVGDTDSDVGRGEEAGDAAGGRRRSKKRSSGAAGEVREDAGPQRVDSSPLRAHRSQQGRPRPSASPRRNAAGTSRVGFSDSQQRLSPNTLSQT
ncbi:hypothetical protein HK102_012643, partial [Quaeritorhiza haematococci]